MDDIIRRRGISEVAHFHCDHFEPFRQDRSGERVGLKWVEAWLQSTRSLRHGAEASVFFSSQRFCVLPGGQRGPHHLPGDTFQFSDTSMAEEDAEIVKLIWEYDRDFHIHIHHEYWTRAPHR
jgi:hypothetical protein